MTAATCIGCGCDDFHACFDEVTWSPCHWERLDRAAGLGVCSCCTNQHTKRWDAGERAAIVADCTQIDPDFIGCRYQKGQHVIPIHVLRGVNAAHATVWEITGVSRNHGHENLYICEAPGFGSIAIYESDVCVTNKPVSRFPKTSNQPSCFGSNPSFQEQAENDCCRCQYEHECLAHNEPHEGRPAA